MGVDIPAGDLYPQDPSREDMIMLTEPDTTETTDDDDGAAWASVAADS